MARSRLPARTRPRCGNGHRAPGSPRSRGDHPPVPQRAGLGLARSRRRPRARGALCIYQGEELGLPEAVLASADIVDPRGNFFSPMYAGRDGCRTPMVWERKSRNAGFSAAEKTSLPVSVEQAARSADTQVNRPDSVYGLAHTWSCPASVDTFRLCEGPGSCRRCRSRARTPQRGCCDRLRLQPHPEPTVVEIPRGVSHTPLIAHCAEHALSCVRLAGFGFCYLKHGQT